MKSNKIRIATGAITIAMLGVVFTGCGKKTSDNIGDSGAGTGKIVTLTVSGSTSVGPLMEKEAEAFMDKNKNIKVEIQQIGSSAGIKNAMDGISEIGMSSRDLKPEEMKSVKDEAICYDGIGVIVHPSNKVDNLSIQQIKDIYTGKITNWKDVGGDNRPIVVVSREEGSGTRDAYHEIVSFKAEEMAPTALISQGNGAVKTTVASNENTIGYVSFDVMMKEGKIDPAIKALKVGGVEATPENVLMKAYVISRPFIVVYKEDKLSQAGKDLIGFIKGEEGQKIAQDSGAIPLK